MSLVGFKSSNDPQQVGKRGPVGAVDDRHTPGDLWRAWGEEFRFTVDAAAGSHNALCPLFWTEVEDGLKQGWGGHRVWCNPPYSSIAPWVRKAWTAMLVERAELVAMLLPANRTEQRWWQDEVEPWRERSRERVILRTRFLPGRIRFHRPGWVPGPGGNRPPFGCVLLVWQ